MKRKRGMPIWLCLLIITIGVFMIISSFSDIQRYERVHDDALVVEAVVVEITSYEDDDGNVDYTAHGRFTYEGKDYRVSCGSSSKRSKLPSIGSHVQVEVNPEDPGETMSSLSGSTVVPYFGAFFLAWGVSGLLARIRIKKLSTNCIPAYDEDTVKNDLRVIVQTRYLRPFWFTLALALHATYIIAPVTAERQVHVVAWVATAFFAVCLFSAISDYRVIERGDYIKRTETLVDKKTEYDSDSGDSYFLIYSNGENEWKRAVGINEYNNSKIGETMASVYFPKEKSPSLVYKHNLTSLA